MRKNNWLPVVILTLLAVIYVIWFTDWFRPKSIHIFTTVRQMHYRHRATEPERVVIFGLKPRNLRLKELKVVALADYEKDPKTVPVWRLISDSNSVPLQSFVYGQRIRGMRPEVAGLEPGNLDSNLVYRIWIKSDHGNGQHDFRISNAPLETTNSDNS